MVTFTSTRHNYVFFFVMLNELKKIEVYNLRLLLKLKKKENSNVIYWLTLAVAVLFCDLFRCALPVHVKFCSCNYIVLRCPTNRYIYIFYN